MNKRFFRAKISVLLLISITLVCCLLYSYAVAEKLSYTVQRSRGYVGKHYSSAKVIEGVVKLKSNNYVREILNDYSNSKEQCVLDEELYKKHLSMYFKYNMLFAILISIIMSSLFIMLRRNRREYFEETCFMPLIILKSYIHRVDGEWWSNSLKHSC